MKEIKNSLLVFEKTELNTVLITVFLSLLVIANLVIGNYFIVWVAVLVAAAFFIWQTPQAGLLAALLVTMIFGERFSLLPLEIEDKIYKIYALDFVLIITFIIWFLQQKANRLKFDKVKDVWVNKNFWLVLFWTFLVINLMRSMVTAIDMSLAIGTFKNYLYLLVYFLVILMVKKKEDILRFLRVFMWGGGLMVLFVVYGLIAGKGLWSEVTPGVRYLSGLHSYYLTFSIIILLVLMVYREYLWSYIKTLILFLVQLAGMVGGMFRHLWLGMLSAGVIIVGWLGWGQKKNFLKLAGVIVVTALTLALIVVWASGLVGSDPNFLEGSYFSSIYGRSMTLFRGGDLVESAAGWRLATWKIALDKFLSNPLLGISFGKKFFFEYREFVDLVDIRNIHNDFAALLVQLGLLGFIPFVVFNYFSFKDLSKLLKRRDVFYKPLSLMLLGFYVVALFGVFFGIYLMYNGTSIFYWTIMALISATVNSEQRKT